MHIRVALLSGSLATRRVGGREAEAEVLAMAGIATWVDYVPLIAHDRVIVIDGNTVLTGSFIGQSEALEHYEVLCSPK